jgi:hypothetical protein
MTEEIESAVKAWKALSNEQQIEFVLRFEKDIRDILVFAGTLEPLVTPPLD